MQDVPVVNINVLFAQGNVQGDALEIAKLHADMVNVLAHAKKHVQVVVEIPVALVHLLAARDVVVAQQVVQMVAEEAVETHVTKDVMDV